MKGQHQANILADPGLGNAEIGNANDLLGRNSGFLQQLATTRLFTGFSGLDKSAHVSEKVCPPAADKQLALKTNHHHYRRRLLGVVFGAALWANLRALEVIFEVQLRSAPRTKHRSIDKSRHRRGQRNDLAHRGDAVEHHFVVLLILLVTLKTFYTLKENVPILIPA